MRWNLINGGYGSVSVAEEVFQWQSGVIPVGKVTSVRAELNGALLSKRPSSFIRKSRVSFRRNISS